MRKIPVNTEKVITDFFLQAFFYGFFYGFFYCKAWYRKRENILRYRINFLVGSLFCKIFKERRKDEINTVKSLMEKELAVIQSRL